jgi:hypothetical protein
MKITVKLPKPRNPLVVPARNKKAGSHDSYRPERRARRVEKYKLHLLLSGKRKEEDYDA